MQARAFTFGLILIALGFFVLSRGPEITTPLAGDFGLATHSRIETELIAPTLLNVAPSNHTWVSAELRGGVQVSGSFSVGGGREIDLYVMNQGNFSDWRVGRQSNVLLTAVAKQLYNFTFTPRTEGTYFFVFDNQDNSRRVVVFTLKTASDVVSIHPVAEYLGWELIVAGTLLSIWAATRAARAKVPST